MTCDHCSSTNFYLMDSPALGPCVCCTPEEMERRATEADATETALATALTVNEEWVATLAAAWDHLAAYLTRQGLNPHAVKLDDPDLDELTSLLGA